MGAITAAAEQVRPHLSGQVQMLRPDTEMDSSDPAVYLFLFYGDVPWEEWNIDRVCIEALGEEEGRRLTAQFEDCLDGEQDGYAFAGELPTS